MEIQDDDIFLVIIDGDKNIDDECAQSDPFSINNQAALDVVERMIKTAAKHGDLVEIKGEPVAEDNLNIDEDGNHVGSEGDIKDELSDFGSEGDIKDDPYESLDPDSVILFVNNENLDNSDKTTNLKDVNNYTLNEYNGYYTDLKKEVMYDENADKDLRLWNVLKTDVIDARRLPRKVPSNGISLVSQLKKNFVDSVTGKLNSSALVNEMAKQFQSIKPPPLPNGYFIKNEVDFECSVCGDLKKSRSEIDRHYQYKHGARYLACYGCGDLFRCTPGLYKHEKRCKSADIELVLKARALFLGRKAKNRPFQQNTDSLLYDYKFRKYYDESSAMDGQGAFPCRECSASFSKYESLMIHMHQHRGERPYKCHICKAAYTYSLALKRHIKATHGEAEFICDQCGLLFKMKYRLIMHIAKHKSKRFPCSECDKVFAQKPGLVYHVNKVHRQLPLPFPCQLCDRRLSRMSRLKDHMKKDHGMDIMTRGMLLRRLPTLSDKQYQQVQNIFLNKDSKAFSRDNYISVAKDVVTTQDPQELEESQDKVLVIKN